MLQWLNYLSRYRNIYHELRNLDSSNNPDFWVSLWITICKPLCRCVKKVVNARGNFSRGIPNVFLWIFGELNIGILIVKAVILWTYILLVVSPQAFSEFNVWNRITSLCTWNMFYFLVEPSEFFFDRSAIPVTKFSWCLQYSNGNIIGRPYVPKRPCPALRV